MESLSHQWILSSLRHNKTTKLLKEENNNFFWKHVGIQGAIEVIMPRWLQTELQRVVNTLQISLRPGQSSLWVLLRQENSSSKCSTATPSGQSFHLANPPGQSLWGLCMWTWSSQPKYLPGVNKGRASCTGWVWAARHQPRPGASLTAVTLPAQAKSQRTAAHCTGECFAFCHAEFHPLNGAW